MGGRTSSSPDVGAHLIWFARNYPVRKENTLLLPNGLITMGVGVPWALAAKLCRPERDVVASVGRRQLHDDLGGAGNGQAASGTKFVTVIFNDSGLGLISVKMNAAAAGTIGCEFTNPDFVKYAESFGAKGYRVERADELKETLKHCLKAKELAVIDAKVDYSGTTSSSFPPRWKAKGARKRIALS